MANLKDLLVNGAARVIGKLYASEFVGKLTGNVTGDVTGNSSTSTKLETTRSLKITDGTNTSTGVNFDGSANVSIPLPSTIKATFSGNLTGNVTGNVSGSSGSCTGNAATATKIKTSISLTTTDGTNTSTGVNFDGSANTSIKLPETIKATISGNSDTATKLETDRTIDGVSFNGSANVVHYGLCETAAGTAAKTVSCTGFTLATGARIVVRFKNTNNQSNPTLNVNSTGAKAIYYRNSAISAGYLAANRTYEFVYNGTQYELIGDLDTNSNTVPQGYCSTSASTAAKTVTCSSYSLLAKSYLMVVMAYNNSVQGAITLNVNGKGAKPIFIDGKASSTTNYTLPAGSYLTYYDGTNYYFRTDGKITGSITGSASSATEDSAGNTISKYISSISGDGTSTTITYTKGDGTSGTFTTKDTTYSAATQSANGLMSSADKKKLDGIAKGAEENQNAFSKVIVGKTTVEADSKTDTLTLVAGDNITLTADTTNDSVTITAKDTTYSVFGASGTSASEGLVPKPDATSGTSKYLREDGKWVVPPDNDTKYTHPSHTAKSSGLYKITVDDLGHVSAATEVVKADITSLGIPGSDTNTHYTATPVLGSSTATSNATSNTSNPYLNIIENSVNSGGIQIKGSGATTVSAANGVLTISSTDNNTWRDVVDNLTTNDATKSLSAAQGKVLNEKITDFDYRGKTNSWSAVNTFTSTDDVTSNSTTASGAIRVTNGGIWAKGGIRGNKVYNAVWNDLADCIPVNDDCELYPGYCYCFDGEKYYKSSKYLDNGIIGIHSDTYGIHMGSKPDLKQMDVAVSGFVLAYVDKEYAPGTPLTCTENGYLTEIKKSDKIEWPEKIVATYWKKELEEYWGDEKNKVKVNGRKWVKVK